jgi:hypothetical protein
LKVFSLDLGPSGLPVSFREAGRGERLQAANVFFVFFGSPPHVMVVTPAIDKKTVSRSPRRFTTLKKTKTKNREMQKMGGK